MFLERVIRPRYRGLVFKFKNGDPEGVLRVLKEWGFSFYELTSPPGFDVESTTPSSVKPYVYLFLFRGGDAFFAMGDRGLKRKEWPDPKKYLIKDERGIENLLLKELSPKSMVSSKLLYIAFWILVWMALFVESRGNFLLSTLISLLGLPLNYLESFLHCHIFGYCGA